MNAFTLSQATEKEIKEVIETVSTTELKLNHMLEHSNCFSNGSIARTIEINEKCKAKVIDTIRSSRTRINVDEDKYAGYEGVYFSKRSVLSIKKSGVSHVLTMSFKKLDKVCFIKTSLMKHEVKKLTS